MVEFSLRNSTARPCLGEIQADCQPCCPFETDVRCLSTRYSRLLGGTIEFSGRTPPRERKGETGWRRGLDSNSRLRFAGRSHLIGPQSAYSACLRQTESPNQESGRLDSVGSQCETDAYCAHFQSQRAGKAVLWERNRAFESNLLRQPVLLFLSVGGVLLEKSILPPRTREYLHQLNPERLGHQKGTF